MFIIIALRECCQELGARLLAGVLLALAGVAGQIIRL